MEKMMKVRELRVYLPGIDCGACGSPNCQAFAEDIVQDKANISSCVFIQSVLLEKGHLQPEDTIKSMEKTWGKDRFRNLIFKNKK
jgi:uncharacterized Fe-S cluster-containing protein